MAARTASVTRARRSAAAEIRRDVAAVLRARAHSGLDRLRGATPRRGSPASSRRRASSPSDWRSPRPAMSGAEPWTGSNIDGKRPRGIQVRARRQPEAAGDRGAQVGQDVAEQVRGDDDVEVLRAPHQIHARGVDEQRLGPDVRDSRARRRRKTRSQNAMLKPCAFDLVTDVSSRLRLRRRASSKAKRMTRSVP